MRLTARGYGLLVAGVLMLAAGIGLGYPELAALGGAAVVAVAGALVFVAWRPRLSVDRAADPDRVTRGEPSVVTLGIANASRFFGASLVARDRLRAGSGSAGSGSAGSGSAGSGSAGSGSAGSGSAGSTDRAGRAGTIPVPLVRLRPGGVTGVTYPVPTRRRGVLEVGPLEIGRRDPLGLVAVVRSYGDPVTVWVRPRSHTIAAVPVGLSRSMDGRVDRVPQGSITFAALREYVRGDDLRHIHWRTSARVGTLMVREHLDTTLPQVVILLDDRAVAHAPEIAGESATFEATCEAAASVLVAAYRDGVHVEIQLVRAESPGSAARPGSSPPGGGPALVGALLDLLAEASLAGDAVRARGRDDALAAAVQRLRVRRLGDTLLYLTGPVDSDDLGLVASLRGAYPSIIAGILGSGAPGHKVDSGLTTTAGLLVVGASDAADFAAAWDGIRAW